MKMSRKCNLKACHPCYFLKKHIYFIILITLIISSIFLFLSIFFTLYTSHSKAPNNSTLQIKNDSFTIQNSSVVAESPIGNSSKSTATSIRLPIIMYHALIEDPSKQNKYFIPPSVFESDLKYLKQEGFTAITMSELIDYVYKGKDLPPKPIVLTFDDGYFNNYYYAYPLLKKYNQKAVISIIGKETDFYSLIKEDNAYYSHITWAQLNEMLISGLVEVQNHTYDLHSMEQGRKGCTELDKENYDDYKHFLENDLGMLQRTIKDHTGFVPNTITYPFGQYSEFSEKVIKAMGFKASLTCAERINTIEKNPDCLYKLGRFLRPPNVSSEDFFNSILQE